MTQLPHGRHLIAGEWTGSAASFASAPAQGPAHRFARGDAALVDRAVRAAEVAFADFGWTLVLPEDDYEVDLIGTGTGPYRLKFTRFYEDGEPLETVIDSTTAPGQVDEYDFIDRLFIDSFEP